MIFRSLGEGNHALLLEEGLMKTWSK